MAEALLRGLTESGSFGRSADIYRPASIDHPRPGELQRPSLVGRRFLIVTAPFGPFARVLADELEKAGGAADRVLFSGGDAASWGIGRHAIHFRRPARDWPETYARLITGYTDVVIFGEGGPYNQAVLDCAGDHSVTTWVLENGYFRPHWITLEKNGVNWNSSLPRVHSAYTAEPAPVTLEPVGKILPHHVRNISLHHLAQIPGRLLYPHYSFSYSTSPWSQGWAHVRKYLTSVMEKILGLRKQSSYRQPFFLACLQRDGDSQLLAHSELTTNVQFIDHVVESFARHAPANVHLVIKNHPLDCGLVDFNRTVRIIAERHCVSDRVQFIDGGHLAELCRATLGLVINNSTSGLAGLEFGTPVKVLGRAFFDFEGLTDQKPLASFWRQPLAPDEALFERFKGAVLAQTQVNGNFHAPGVIRATARRIVSRFSDAEFGRAPHTNEPPINEDAVARRQACQ